MRRWAWMFGLAAAGVGLLLVWLAGGGIASEDPAPPLPPGAVATPASPGPVAPARRNGHQDPGLVRRPARRPVRPCEGFEKLLDRLVALGVEMAAEVRAGGKDAARPKNPRALALLAEIERCVARPEEAALFVLTGLPEGPSGEPDELRRAICLHFVARGLERRARLSRRGPLDRLVGTILDVIVQGERLADDLGLGLLAGAPYLGLAHEAQVLDLTVAAERTPFLAPVATALLTTLWRNLERAGVRSSAELAALALFYKDDAVPARRLAALRHLLVAQQGRFRDLVVAEVRRRRDRGLAREMATAAAMELKPAQALEVLERLLPVGREGFPGAFMLLGHRDLDVVAQAYHRRLADGVNAPLRAELVTGAGFQRRAAGLEVAELAFAHDPDPGVRLRAVFAITARAPAERAEAVFSAALEDPALSGDPERLGRLAAALENVEDVNVVARVGRRLLARPRLLDADRQRLSDFLKRRLPR